MRIYNFWSDDQITREAQQSPKSRANQAKTIELIDSIGGLRGEVLDIGERNLFTEILENKYHLSIDSTSGDLDIALNAPRREYDFVHYNHVIEHQFNPLFTLLEIKKILKPGGILILGTPMKPNWITWPKCHYHEFDEYRLMMLIARAEYKIIKSIHFYHQISIKGIRPLLGSFYKRLFIGLLTDKRT